MSLIIPKTAFELLSGELKTFSRTSDAGRPVKCAFCSDCGTRIYHEPSVMPDTLNIKPGTLDNRSSLTPALHLWTDSKQPWVPISQRPHAANSTSRSRSGSGSSESAPLPSGSPALGYIATHCGLWPGTMLFPPYPSA